MSSSSESYNTLAIYRIEVNHPCLCRDQPASKLREAWKPNNSGRHFYNCTKSMNMKLRINDLLVRNGQVVELQKKVKKHKLLRKAEKELAKARIQELLIEIERLKKMLKNVVFIALVCLLFVVIYFKL
uniref:Uncharacterized protein n=1 Tax=Lactuca sativa TaxID=4236 RepID=A0A9R1X0J1_LACSA|nr:hypothetical protein LSAT_V11C800446090 [Lactuca sativa]